MNREQSLKQHFPYDVVAVVSPHPDDSCIAVGGLLARLAQEKPECAVHVLVMTSGYRGVSDQYVSTLLQQSPPGPFSPEEARQGLSLVEAKKTSPLSPQQAQALEEFKTRIRRAEVEEEARVLSFTPHFLNLELYDQHSLADRDRASVGAALKKIHSSGSKRLLIHPGAHDAHDTHKLCSQLAVEVMNNRFPGQFERWAYESPWTQIHVRADIVVPVPEPAFQKKLEATRAHRSQGERNSYDTLVESLAIRNAAVMSELLGSFNISAAYNLGKYAELMARQSDRVIYF